MQLQNMRNRQHHNHKIRDHIQAPRTHIHCVPCPTYTPGNSTIPIESEWTTEEERFENDRHGPHDQDRHRDVGADAEGGRGAEDAQVEEDDAAFDEAEGYTVQGFKGEDELGVVRGGDV
jgi:hypothetical protein